MLEESHANAAADMAVRALLEARVDAARIIDATESALAADAELLAEDERAVLDDAMKRLRRLMEEKGADRRALIEATEALAEYQRFELEATYLTLTANVVTAAVQVASLRGQIEATRDIATQLLSGADPARVFRLIADEALKLTGAEVAVYDPAGRTVVGFEVFPEVRRGRFLSAGTHCLMRPTQSWCTVDAE